MFLLIMCAGKYTHTHLGRGDGGVVCEGGWVSQVFFSNKKKSSALVYYIKLKVLAFHDQRLQNDNQPNILPCFSS